MQLIVQQHGRRGLLGEQQTQFFVAAAQFIGNEFLPCYIYSEVNDPLRTVRAAERAGDKAYGMFVPVRSSEKPAVIRNSMMRGCIHIHRTDAPGQITVKNLKVIFADQIGGIFLQQSAERRVAADIFKIAGDILYE